ncbi:MAG: putative sugar nucleotidyl transferase [Ignavibacteriales bacterium]|nr:putative sugar nucleotidyl transferase [Ignavibacteriales bacterium]
MPTQICIFEDDCAMQFLPLVYFRPVYNLICGMSSLGEKIAAAYPGASISLHMRPSLEPLFKTRYSNFRINELIADSVLFINGRALAGLDFASKIPLEGPAETVYYSGKAIVGARLSGTLLEQLKQKPAGIASIGEFDGVRRVQVDVPLVAYPWDLINRLDEQMKSDFERKRSFIKGKQIKGNVSPGVHLLNKKNIFIDEGSLLQPGVVIDAENGPVYIGKQVTVMPHATIVGPAYIGDGSIIKIGAQVYGSTYLGRVCKVGGEIAESVMHAYANKQHEGFLGHSYLAPWVNLGAGTTNSDLKNNYSTVRVQLAHETVDSESVFVGMMIGDHSKSAINTVFNAGTVVGVSSNVFGSGFPPKFIPSFSWGGAGEAFATYNYDRALDVAVRVMQRRGVTMLEEERVLFHTIFEMTTDDRKRMRMPQ